MSDFQPQGEFAPNQRRGHESYDIRLKGIIFTAIALFAVAVTVHIGLGFVMDEFSRLHRLEKSRRPILLRERRGQFPPPNLQQSPAADMARFRQQEEEQLNSYGWTDRQNRVAHIPIERAMRLVVANGLPTRKPDGPGPRSKEKP